MEQQANRSIGCTVKQCVHHCQSQNYCTLSQINVGTHETNPTKVECTDCNSFAPKMLGQRILQKRDRHKI